MPIYEYTCPSCGHDFDKMQKISDPTPACPSCGAEQAQKRVSRTSFQLKGGGWYVTDYASGANKNKAAEASKGDAAKDSGASTDAAAESKPSTAESKPAATESKASPDKSSAA